MSSEHGLTFAMTQKADFLVVELVGTVDEFTVSELHRAFAAVYSTPSPTVVLDMTRVPYVDSAGFGALINIQKRLTESGHQLILVGCQEPVRTALSQTRLEVLLPHYPSIEKVPVRR